MSRMVTISKIRGSVISTVVLSKLTSLHADWFLNTGVLLKLATAISIRFTDMSSTHGGVD